MIDLDAIENRLTAIRESLPWEAVVRSEEDGWFETSTRDVVCCGIVPVTWQRPNAEFIEQAPQDVADLIAEVKFLRSHNHVEYRL